ncbi:Mediator of RNA polymerase II transcription subunit 23 [Exaiptasia diaphana]|nr:Mediator of RNA polymerase II transcription subunit 23 [Exaiptasia diaphana]
MDYKVKLKSLLDDALKIEALEVAFHGFLRRKDGDDESVKASFLEAFKPFWDSVPKELKEEIVQQFMTYIHEQKSLRRIDFCFDFLVNLVEKNVISARLICEAALKSEHLKFENEVTWCKTFQLIYRIVGGTDYKGCRGVLSLLFVKFSSIPNVPDPAYSSRIHDALKVLQYIFDRKACLLPAYFVISEIYNNFPEVQESQVVPHWSISKLISSYVDSFRPLAHIVSVTGRPFLLPIIGHPGSSLSVWKLEPSTRSFPIKGLLPYDRDLLEPQDPLLQYVIGQPYSRDIVCTLLGLNKQQKQRCPALEDLLVDLIVIAMEKTENKPVEMGVSGCQLLWHHLSSHLIFFVLFQFASFPHMVTQLYDKLSGRTLKKGRNHLMWVLLQFISGSIQKNPLSDFKPVLRLFELLYPENEPLPAPDINSSDSVHSLAMACIWIHLTKKAELEKLTIKSPTSHILKNQLEFIHEWSNNKSTPYSMNNYAIPILCNACKY